MAVSNSKMLQLERKTCRKNMKKRIQKKTKWKKDNSHNMSGPFFYLGWRLGIRKIPQSYVQTPRIASTFIVPSGVIKHDHWKSLGLQVLWLGKSTN
jgi:hypothetical protein